MNLRHSLICELLQYASDNNYCVELRPDCAVIDGFYGESVFILCNEHHVKRSGDFHFLYSVRIYKGEIKVGCTITLAEFKRMFAKR